MAIAYRSPTSFQAQKRKHSHVNHVDARLFEIYHFDRLICNFLCKLLFMKCHMLLLLYFDNFSFPLFRRKTGKFSVYK